MSFWKSRLVGASFDPHELNMTRHYSRCESIPAREGEAIPAMLHDYPAPHMI
ncbi:MAG: hypothetical protein WC877_04720 [Dehalococcoidales bacterium]